MPTAKPKSEPTYGLVFEQGGAPHTPHRLVDVPGYYVPGVPSPVGGPGEPSLEQARAFDANPNVPLSLVEIPAAEMDDLREEQTAYFNEVRGVLKELRNSGGVVPGRESDDVREAVAHLNPST